MWALEVDGEREGVLGRVAEVVNDGDWAFGIVSRSVEGFDGQGGGAA